jgi:hypothetical protein
MDLVELDHEVCVYPFLRVSKFVILMHLRQKENTNTLTLFIVDDALYRVSMVNYPSQGFNARKKRGLVAIRLATVCRFDL